MASGHVNRIKRPNTWLLRPDLRRGKFLPTRSRPHMALIRRSREVVGVSASRGIALQLVFMDRRQWQHGAARLGQPRRCHPVLDERFQRGVLRRCAAVGHLQAGISTARRVGAQCRQACAGPRPNTMEMIGLGAAKRSSIRARWFVAARRRPGLVGSGAADILLLWCRKCQICKKCLLPLLAQSRTYGGASECLLLGTKQTF